MANDDGSTLTVTPGDRDAIIRTVIGEAGNQPDIGKAAVAHTIMNRTISGGFGGDSPTSVVMAPNQFEANANGLKPVSASSPQYQSVGKIVDGVLSGDIADPTNGAVNFLNPDTVMARSGRLPAWASGTGVQIGQHVFMDGSKGRQPPASANASDAISSAVGEPPQAGQGSVAPGVLAFAADGLTPAVEGKPIMPQAAASQSPKPAGVAGMSDGDLEALLTGKPAATSATPVPGVTFVQPAAPPDVSKMSDADLEHMLTGGASQAAPGQMPTGTAPLSSAQVATGRDPQTGEVVVGGKPFTPDAGHYSGAVNFANGALQGGGNALMAGVQALKEKLVNDDPLSLGDLYSQAKSTYDGARTDYQQANPLTSALTEAGGSLSTAVPAMAAGGSGLAATGNALLDGARAIPGLAAAVPAAEATGSFLAGNAGASNMLLRGASIGANGAVQGGTAAALASGLSDQPFADQVKQGAEMGGAIGAGIPAIVGAGKGIANKLLGAAGVSQETAQLAQTAKTYGIPIRPGQITDSPGVRFMDSTLSRTPGMGYGGEAAAQGSAFNKAVANTIGETADKITPAVMSAAKTRIGAALDAVAANTTIQRDPPFVADLTKIAGEAKGVLADSEIKPLVTQMQNVLGKFDGSGAMNGDAYQALTRTGSPLDRLQSSTDSNLRFYAGRIRDALDDAMERSASPDVLQQLQTARGQYKAMKTIEPLVEKSTNGDVSPAGLMQAVRSSYNGMAYGGGGDLGDLARIGQRFLKEPPSSGTAERTGAGNMLTRAGSLGAAALGLKEVAPYAAPYASAETFGPAIATMASTFGAGRVASSVLRSPAVANMLVNSALGNPSMPGPVGKMLLAASRQAPGALPLAYNRLTSPRRTANQ